MSRQHVSGTRSKQSIDYDLASTIAHHDAEIVTLGNRMSGVEQGVKSLEGTVQSGFSAISSSLAEMRGRTGPSLGTVVGTVAAGGAVVAMIAGAITILVQSTLSPELTELKDAARMLSRDHETRIARESKELQDLREDRRDRIESDVKAVAEQIEGLKEQTRWAPDVKRASGKGF